MLKRGLLPFFLLGILPLSAESLPPDFAAVLQDFRADGPKGWSYTQTTVAGNESLVEHFNPAEPDFQRWTLVRKDGRAPTPDEIKTYNEGRSRRSSGATAPRLQDQLDLASATVVRNEGTRHLWHFHLQSGGLDDRAADSMGVTITFDQSTRTIETVEIASTAPFSPVFGVHIASTMTRMNYSRPTADRPSLLLSVTIQVRGRAFWFKSLDQDMTVTYTDQTPALRK